MLLFFLFSGDRRLSLGFWFFVCSFLLPPRFVDGEICWVASCESAHDVFSLARAISAYARLVVFDLIFHGLVFLFLVYSFVFSFRPFGLH